LDARRETDPGDADTAVARMEQRIVGGLARGGRWKRDLQKAVNAGRAGIWVWDTAMKNLMRDGQVRSALMPRGKQLTKQEYYWLAESVESDGRRQERRQEAEGAEVPGKANGRARAVTAAREDKEGVSVRPPIRSPM